MTISNVQQHYGSLSAAILSSLSILLLSGVSLAQVTTTITPDPTLATEVNQNGKVHEINGGDRPEAGPNLFHSFHRFNLGTGDMAHFIGKPGIENIIGRVTGPEPSRIDGTVKADASLFLLNPQGILFGPDATLDIHGSFHATTADVLHFADGTEFSARLTEKSTLTVAAPSAFGFLRANPAGIAIEGSHLEVPEGKTLSLVGGNMTIVGDGDPSSGQPTLAASGGRINLASVAASGNVTFDAVSELPKLGVESFEQLGNMLIAEGALVDVSGEGGGTIAIRSGKLLIDQSWIFADTQGNRDGAKIGVDIEADELGLSHGGLVTTDVTEAGTGNAGTLSIVARNLRVSDGSQIRSTAYGPGNGGMVTVRATEIRLEGAAPDNRFSSGILVSTQGTMENAGDAGDLLVEAQHLQLAGGVQISSSTSGPGDGGNLTIQVDRLVLLRGGVVGSAALGDGLGGQVTIEANEEIRLSGSIADGVPSWLLSASSGNGNPGRIRLIAPSIVVDGSFVGTAPLGRARTAEIEIMVDRLTLTNLGLIGSVTNSDISAGTITINATDTVSISTGGIFTSTLGAGTGDAGNIVINTTHLQLTQDSRIDSSTRGPGHGGTATITASGTVSIIGRNSGIFTNTGMSGAGGKIELQAQQVQLAKGAMISSSSSGAGDAGDIRIAAQEIDLRGNSVITTTVDQGEASGGNIRIGGMINADGDIIESLDSLMLEGSRITANTDAGDGANITIGARQVVLDGNSAVAANTNAGVGGNVAIAGTVAADGQGLSRAETIVLRKSQITANAQAGQGGRIDIVAEVFLADPDSVVDASSQVGLDGEVNIEAVVSNLSGVVTPLSQRLASEAPLLRDRCVARLRQGGASSFVERERAGIPSAPDGLLPSRLDVSDAEIAWSGESRSHGIAMASEPSWRLSAPCP